MMSLIHWLEDSKSTQKRSESHLISLSIGCLTWLSDLAEGCVKLQIDRERLIDYRAEEDHVYMACSSQCVKYIALWGVCRWLICWDETFFLKQCSLRKGHACLTDHDFSVKVIQRLHLMCNTEGQNPAGRTQATLPLILVGVLSE